MSPKKALDTGMGHGARWLRRSFINVKVSVSQIFSQNPATDLLYVERG
jgi:hypothetical protein